VNKIKRITSRLFSSTLTLLLLASACHAQADTPPTAAECGTARTAVTSWTTLYEGRLGRDSDTDAVQGLANMGSSNAHWPYHVVWERSGILDTTIAAFGREPAFAKWNHLRAVPADILLELKDQYLSLVRTEAEAQYRKRRHSIFALLQNMREQIEKDARTAPPATVSAADVRVGDAECQTALNSLQALEISFSGIYGDRNNADVSSYVLVHDTSNGRQGFFRNFSSVQPQITAIEADKLLGLWPALRTSLVDTLKILKDDYLANGTYENPGTNYTIEARTATRFKTLRARLHLCLEALRTQIRRDQALARRLTVAVRPPETFTPVPAPQTVPSAIAPSPAAPAPLSLLGENSGGSALPPPNTLGSPYALPPNIGGGGSYGSDAVNQFGRRGRDRRGGRRYTNPGGASALYASQLTFSSHAVTGNGSPGGAGSQWLVYCSSDISRIQSEIERVRYTFRNAREVAVGTFSDTSTRTQVSTTPYNRFTVYHHGADSADVLIEVIFKDGSVASGRHLLRAQVATVPPRPAL
jgi:hypothetical protein